MSPRKKPCLRGNELFPRTRPPLPMRAVEKEERHTGASYIVHIPHPTQLDRNWWKITIEEYSGLTRDSRCVCASGQPQLRACSHGEQGRGRCTGTEKRHEDTSIRADSQLALQTQPLSKPATEFIMLDQYVEPWYWDRISAAE